MGHTLLIWTASLLAQAGEGQIVIENPAVNDGRSCGCQMAPAPAPSSGLFGFGLFNRFRSSDRVEDGTFATERFQPTDDNQVQSENRPGFFSRFMGRIGNLFGRPSYDQSAGQVEIGIAPTDPYSGIASGPARVPVVTTASEPPLRSAPADNKVEQVKFTPSAAPAPAAQEPANLGVILPKYVNRIGHEGDFSWVTGQLGQANGQWVIHYATPETADTFGGKLVLVGIQDASNLHVGDLISIQGGLMAQNGRVIAAYQVRSISLIERN